MIEMNDCTSTSNGGDGLYVSANTDLRLNNFTSSNNVGNGISVISLKKVNKFKTAATTISTGIIAGVGSEVIKKKIGL